MSLASLVESDFTPEVRQRGDEYFAAGRVKEVERGDCDVVYRVSGSQVYSVELDWSQADEGLMHAGCDCPYYDETGVCKHVWAALRQADKDFVKLQLPPVRRLSLEDISYLNDLNGFDDDDDDLGDIYTPLPPLYRPPNATPRTNEKPKWQLQLEQVKNLVPRDGAVVNSLDLAKTKLGKITYTLDVAASQVNRQLVMRLLVQEPKQNGDFGKRKNLSMSRWELAKWQSHPDYSLLAWLLAVADDPQPSSWRSSYGNSDALPSLFTLPEVIWPQILPNLIATGRFGWALQTSPPLSDEDFFPILYDDGPPWKFALGILADDEQQVWKMQGTMQRAADGLQRDLKTAICPPLQGLILWPDGFAKADCRGQEAWIELLRRDEPIVVPYAQRDQLIEQLYRLPNLPAANWPENLRYDEVRIPPQGKLTLRSRGQPGSELLASVTYLYGSQSFTLRDTASGRTDHQQKSIILRDLPAERGMLSTFPLLGFKSDSYYNSQSDFILPLKNMPAATAKLMDEGWQVEAQGALIRSAGVFSFSVNSGVDWFELAGVCDFDGQHVTFPDVLAAIKKGERFVKLGDGTQGLLPEDWLKRYGNLAELGEMNDDKLIFKPSQALLLDAMLASQADVKFDRHFSGLREKLRSFRGIAPINKPRGFVGELRHYQQEGLGWLKFLQDFRFGGCLADDMGLGKTIQVLALLEQQRSRRLKKGEVRRPSLVVVPRSLIFNWLDEAQRFAPKLKMLNFSQSDRTTKWEQVAEHDVILTTYGVLLRDVVEWNKHEFDYVILDEAQAIKNTNSQSAKACRLLNAQHRLALTGTPVENHVGELWSILEFLNPGMLGRFAAFNKLVDASRKDQPETQTQSLGAIAQAVAPFILRRTKQQVLKDLPEKTEKTIYCDLSKIERKKYDEIRDYYRASLANTIQVKGLEKAKIHVLEALLRLRQASCHLGLLDEAKASESSAKLEVLFEQLDELVAEGHKALVFSQFTSLLAIVRTHLDKRKIRYEYLDGQTRDRQQRVENFQNDATLPLFLISLKAGGRGLNLTAADYVFILDPWWNPAVEAQAVDRAHRIGQTQPVFAYRLIARDTVEEKILELQRSKRDLADAIISADSSVLRNLTPEDLQMLLG